MQTSYNSVSRFVVSYRESFKMKTGNENPIVADKESSFIQEPTSSPLVFDSVKNKYNFPPVVASNSFGTLDYDVQIKTKIDFSVNHVFISMSIPELNTIHHICELEPTQLLTIIAMSVENPQLAAYLLTGNRSKFPL